MPRLPTVMCACVVVILVGCQQHADEASSGDLVVTSADPAHAIEARYREGEHSLILRSRQSGPAFQSEIIDERGHNVTQLASNILERTPVRSPQGELTIPIHGLFENSRKLRTALQLPRHGIRPAAVATSEASLRVAKLLLLTVTHNRLNVIVNRAQPWAATLDWHS